MMSIRRKVTKDNKKSKISLGKSTESGYDFSTKIDLTADLEVQIKKVMHEKYVKDELIKRIEDVKLVVKKYKDKQKINNPLYYHRIGKTLRFLERYPFKSVKITSALRNIYEQYREILPSSINLRIAIKHMLAMYYLGKVDKVDLDKATWWKWYDLAKFPKLFTTAKKYKEMLEILEKHGGSVREIVPKKYRH